MFELAIWRDQLYVKTNEGAPRYRVFKVDPLAPARAAWREIVEESDATLLGMTIVGEHLALTYLRNAASEIELHDLEGKLVRKVDLPPLGTSDGISGNPDEDTGYFSYTSFTEPLTIYKTSVQTGKLSEWTRVELPIATAELTTEQVFYPSKDGTQVSMFIVRRRDARRHRKLPCSGLRRVQRQPDAGLLGLARCSSSEAASTRWNLRGGGEYGDAWHEAGMLSRKQNVFDDFIAAAEYLIAEG
jgi:prolyl oligopeptidase